MSGRSGGLSSRLMFGDDRLANWREDLNGISGTYCFDICGKGSFRDDNISDVLTTIGFGISGVRTVAHHRLCALCVWLTLTVSWGFARPSSQLTSELCMLRHVGHGELYANRSERRLSITCRQRRFARPRFNPWFYPEVDRPAMISAETDTRPKTNKFLSQFRVPGMNSVVESHKQLSLLPIHVVVHVQVETIRLG